MANSFELVASVLVTSVEQAVHSDHCRNRALRAPHRRPPPGGPAGMRNSGSFRVAVVVSHPTQYLQPWFRWLAQRAPVDLRVFYLWDFGVSAQARSPVRDGVRLGRRPCFRIRERVCPQPGANRRARKDSGASTIPGCPDASRPGAPTRSCSSATSGPPTARDRLGLARGVPVIFRGDSHFLGRATPGWSRTLPLRWLFRRFAAVTFTGAANRAYFEGWASRLKSSSSRPIQSIRGFSTREIPATAMLRRPSGSDWAWLHPRGSSCSPASFCPPSSRANCSRLSWRSPPRRRARLRR